VDIQDVSSYKRTLQIEIPSEDVNAEIEKAYEEVRTTVPVRGFRKGRAPRNVLRMRFGEYVKGEVIEKLVPPALEKAVKDANLEILRPLDAADMNPPVDELSVKENESLTFEVTVDVKPEIIIPDLTQLEVEKVDINVTKEHVDSFLDQLREERASFVPVEDRPVQAGDYVTLSISATSGPRVRGDEVLEDQEDTKRETQDARQETQDESQAGMPVPPSPESRVLGLESETEQILEVAENMPIPELAEHLVGMNPDDEKEFSISFPADHQVKDLAGKEVNFRVGLHKITEKHLPPLDDDFAKDLGKDDLQHLTAGIWNQLVESGKQGYRGKQESDLLSQLLEKSQFEVPEFLVEEQAKVLMRSDKQRAQAEGAEANEEELSQYRSSAVDAIKKLWIFGEITKREEVDVSDEEIKAEVTKIAERLDKDPQKYMRLMEATDRIAGIRAAIWESKIFDLLIERASPKRTLIV
jgi:trigger factor